MTLGELKKYLNGFKRLKGTQMVWTPDVTPPHPPENLESPDDLEIGSWEGGVGYTLDGLKFTTGTQLEPTYRRVK